MNVVVVDHWTCIRQPVISDDGAVRATSGQLWRCDNMQCVDRTRICNEVHDCADRSDERQCGNDNLFYSLIYREIF